MSFPSDANSPGGSSVPPRLGPQLPNPYGSGMSYDTAYAPQAAPSYGGPYGPPGTPPTPSKGSGCLVGGIVAGILALFVALCAACGGVGFWALEEEHKETARVLSVDFRNDPKVKEEVGEIQEITYNWGATLSREVDDDDVYDVRGDKGSAQLVVQVDEDGNPLRVTLQNGRGEWELPSDEATDGLR